MAKGKSTPEDQRLIKDETADRAARASAIFNVAVDGLEHLEPDIASLLDHEWHDIRSEALAALVMFWTKDQYLAAAFRMLAEDAEKYARKHAALILTQFARTTGRERERILRALGRTVRMDPEELVACEAYVGMVQLLAPERKTAIRDGFVRERDVDWKLLQPYLPN